MSYWNLDKRNCLQYCRHFLVDNSVFHVERCMSVMQSGTQMIKLKHGAKGLVRLFYLDEHRTCIRWRPSRKSEKAKIIIDSIYKVTEGRQSEIFHRHAEGNFDPSCCFTIYHGNHMESLDLITSNSEEARTWITGLKYLMAGISDEDSLAKRQRTHDHWVKQTFQEADKNGDGLLNIEEIHQLMHKLNVNLPRRKVRQMFQEADTDENQGTLNFEEFSVFYKMMSLRRDLYLLLLSYSDKKDHLTVEDFTQFLKTEQKGLSRMFMQDSYMVSITSLWINDFEKHLLSIQKIANVLSIMISFQEMNNVTTEYCLDIVRKFEVSEENRNQNVLGIEGFTNFMCSPACDVFNPLHSEVHQDMEQPLCNYFIASSHNTYLTGDQLLSQSKIEMYARVLQDGCRCLEVDCWDGPDGEPVVHHGYTLTSKIPFKDVIDVINKNAFTKNEFPIILSIENHCNIQQQKKIAQYLKEIFGDKLDLTSVNIGDLKQLPSPQSLKGKILVKGKKLPYSLGADAEEGDVSDEDSADEIEDDCKLNFSYNNGTTEHQIESFIRKKLESLLKESQIRDKEDTDSFTVRALLKATHEGLNVNFKQNSGLKDTNKKSHSKLMGSFGKHKKAAKSKSKSHSTSDDEDSQQNVSGKESGQLYSRLARRRKTMKLCRDLSDLVVYTNSVAAQDIIDDGSVGNVLSFSETRAHQVIQQKSEQFILYNQQQLTRIYPSAYRIDSSNFNPVPYWNVGCQLVALNYQSEGRVMQLNQAKFRMNGNCGYILKPQQMCKGTFNPYSGDPLPALPKKQLILKIISGQQLPKPPDSMLGDRGEIIDPFVEVEIIGLPADCCKDQTRVVDDNGFNPVWEESLTFTIHMPEIALVRFLVWDHDPIGRDFVGQRTVAFSSLMPGYRHVYLEGLTEASIFVHITINEIYGKWSPLILNPSYTIMHFLGATKNKQLIGLRGLFNKNSKHNSVENSTNYIRKRSLGDRILRRTASAPAKGRKKSKMGFQETTDLKESVSDTLDLKEKEGGFRQASRSLQLRPISMPVEKYLLAGLPPPDQDASRVVEVTKSESTSAESRNNTSEDCTNAKKTITSFEKKSSFMYQLKKDVPKSGTCDTLCPDEKGESLNFAIGIAETYFSTEYWKSNLPNEFVHVKEDLERKKQEDISYMDPKTLEMTALCKEKQKITDEKANMESRPILNTTVTNVCGLNCRPAIPDSDISRLINEVSLADERERDSSISKLIEQVDITSDQADLTLVSSPSDINKENRNLKSIYLPCTSLNEQSIILDDKSLNLKSAGSASSIGSRAENTIISTPKTTGCSLYTIIHEASVSPVSQSPLMDTSVCKDTTKDAKDSCINEDAKHTSCITPVTMQKANPKRKCGTNWEFLSNSNSYTSDIQNTIVVPVTCANSTGSSLMEIDGELQDLLITAFEYKIEDMSQVASPVKHKHSQDTLCYNKTICEPLKNMDFPNENLAEDLKFNNGKNQYFPYPHQQRFELLYNNCLQISDAQNELLNIPQSASISAALKPKNVLPSPFPGAQKQQSPCKSKSLGDLTSEDISCNFESKYKYISRGFITSGMRDNMVATLKAKKPSTTDILTEQLRKLVSFDQEESCQSFCSKQNDDCPKMLVRKLSSRSQSRVRNIASRAKERQEANKQKPSYVSSNVTDIVLRNKPPVLPHIINRHSTGSYIASYLDNFNTDDLESRGVPEGACSSLHLGYSDRFCTDDSLLETKLNENDKPEIYFLLRL